MAVSIQERDRSAVSKSRWESSSCANLDSTVLTIGMAGGPVDVWGPAEDCKSVL